MPNPRKAMFAISLILYNGAGSAGWRQKGDPRRGPICAAQRRQPALSGGAFPPSVAPSHGQSRENSGSAPRRPLSHVRLFVLNPRRGNMHPSCWISTTGPRPRGEQWKLSVNPCREVIRTCRKIQSPAPRVGESHHLAGIQGLIVPGDLVKEPVKSGPHAATRTEGRRPIRGDPRAPAKCRQ